MPRNLWKKQPNSRYCTSQGLRHLLPPPNSRTGRWLLRVVPVVAVRHRPNYGHRRTAGGRRRHPGGVDVRLFGETPLFGRKDPFRYREHQSFRHPGVVLRCASLACTSSGALMSIFVLKSPPIWPSGVFARETCTGKPSLRVVLMYKRDLYREILEAGEGGREKRGVSERVGGTFPSSFRA